MLSLEIKKKMSKFFFSRLLFILDFICIWIKGDSTTLDALMHLSKFFTGTGLPGDVLVLMHSKVSTCPQVGAKLL
jgi:hypothetical protein